MGAWVGKTCPGPHLWQKEAFMDSRTRALVLLLRVLAALCAGIAGLTAVRLLFRVCIANPANPVTTVVYAASRPFLFPWDRLWPPVELPGMVLERATVVALAVYLVLSFGLALLGQVSGDRMHALAYREQEKQP